MYHYQLNVLIFSKNPIWEQVLQGVKPLDNFEHNFVWYDCFSEETLQKCKLADIILIQLPLSKVPMDIDGYCTKRHFKKVFCQDIGALEVLPSSGLLGELDEIWVTPLTNELIIFYFTKLIKQIKLEKDLWLTQNYLDTAMDSIPDLIWFKDKYGAHVKVNSGFCDAVGKTKEDCQNRGHYYIWDMKKEEYEKGEYVCLETEEIVMREKKTCLFDENVKSSKGMRQFKTYKSPIFGEDEELLGTVGIAHDVTDLQNLGAELEIILESMNFAGAIISDLGQVINVNRKFIEYFKQEKFLLLGLDYFAWKNETFHLPKDSKILGKSETLLNRNGIETFFEVNEEPLYDVFRQIVGHYCIYRDITEHKRNMEFIANYQKYLEEDVLAKTKTLQLIQQQMIVSFADIITSRDTLTGGHIKRTSKYVDIIVDALKEESPYQDKIDSSFADHMSLAAPLHDIGKISIPDLILNKPGKYQPFEYELMKCHATLGGEILSKTISCLEDKEYYLLACDMATYHHERWDGTGYPKGIKGDKIPLAARIMSVADVFDALISKRPYKEAFTINEAYRIIQEGSGSHFDPVIVSAFIRIRANMEAAAYSEI